MFTGFAPRYVIKFSMARAERSWLAVPHRLKVWEQETGKGHIAIIGSAAYDGVDKCLVVMELDVFADMASDLAKTRPEKWLLQTRNDT